MNKLCRAYGFLGFILFCTGATVMSFEMLASRILAPFIGTTIAVWTGIIGVLLAALSAGYYAGGVLADRRKNIYVLSCALFMAGCGTLLVLLLRPYIGNIHSILFWDIRFLYGVRSIVASLALFAVPLFFLGCVSVYAIRLVVRNEESFGITNGLLYGLSTIGSAFGIFFTSFYLIPRFSTSHIILILAGVVFILAFITAFGKKLISNQH